MTLSSPEDMDEPLDSDTVETHTETSDGSENGENSDETVDVDDVMVELSDGHTEVLPEAVELNRQMLYNPSDFGLASGDELDDLRETVDRQQEILERYEQVFEELYADILRLARTNKMEPQFQYADVNSSENGVTEVEFK